MSLQCRATRPALSQKLLGTLKFPPCHEQLGLPNGIIIMIPFSDSLRFPHPIGLEFLVAVTLIRSG